MSDIYCRQNKPENIKYLKAQRQAYTDIKRYMAFSFIIGIIIPTIFLFLVFAYYKFFPNFFKFEKETISAFSIILGIFLTIFVEFTNIFIKKKKEEAAKIQEKFDTEVFDLVWDIASVGDQVDIEQILNKYKKFDKKKHEDSFGNWYTEGAAKYRYPKGIAFCQQQNIYWDNSLREGFITFLIIVSIITTFVLILFSIYVNLPFIKFLSDIVILALPLFLYLCRSITEHRETISLNSQLKKANKKLIDTKCELSKEDFLFQCRLLQTAIYHYRKLARPIPDCYYNAKKKNQEEVSRERMKQNY